MKLTPSVFILDVDGVMTTGQFLYSANGKVFKIFGPDDNDALSLLKPHLEIQFLSADKRGFPISQNRIVDDMNYPLHLVSSRERPQWIEKRYPLEEVIYIGDGIFDHYVFRKVGYAIATANANILAKQYANFVTQNSGGNRAVSEACLHILEKFFIPYDPLKPLTGK